jgi:aminocarboxymuconate-semialdehyde decarboxylase
VVDAHGHCLVSETKALVRGTPIEPLVDFDERLFLTPGRVDLLDAHRIDTQVISINAFWYDAPLDQAREIVRVQNERMAEWCAPHTGRFIPMASVALQDPQVAIEQLDEAVHKLGFRGVAIGGSVRGEELSTEKFAPFWAKAQELDALIFIHPQPSPGTTINARMKGNGNLVNTIGNPLETTVCLSHLIFDGTLDRFPKLKICAAHGGGYLPSYLGRSDAACTRQPSACTGRREPVDTYFKHQIVVDSMVFREEGLRHLVAEVGATQVVYGTDLPFPWPVEVEFILGASFLSDSDKTAILGGNMKRLLQRRA